MCGRGLSQFGRVKIKVDVSSFDVDYIFILFKIIIYLWVVVFLQEESVGGGINYHTVNTD